MMTRKGNIADIPTYFLECVRFLLAAVLQAEIFIEVELEIRCGSIYQIA
jgi:hypothetical protein